MKLTPIIQKAINTATRLHHGQTRKTDNTLPYIVHPFSVAWIVSQYTDDENTITAALLHDVLEDVAGYSAEDMRRDFGEKITSIVQEVSEDKDPNKENNDPIVWMTRKLGYITHLRSASTEAMLVCAADKIHNLRSMVTAHQLQGDAMWERFNAPADKQLWFYEQVTLTLQERLTGNILAELQDALSKTQALFEIDVYRDMKVAFVECDNCELAVKFEYENRTFFYCPTHKFGVNVPSEKMTNVQMCQPCDKPMARYDLYSEDNVCPLCQHMLSVAYVPKK